MTCFSAKRLHRLAAVLCACASLPSCLGTDLGVQGGSSALSAKFQGIDSVTVLSPTSVQISWTPVSGYSNYNVYISTQDAPVGNSVFNQFTLNNLKPGTNYSFSVAGVRGDGGQDGIAKQVSASTWTPFLGVSAALDVDSSNVKVLWKYFSGPSFQIFYNIGSPPPVAAYSNPPQMTTQSNSGVTVGGLQANTLYYFSVIAKYPDGTTSLPLLTSVNVNAQFTSATLVTLPTVTTASSFTSTAYPQFAVTGAPATYQTQIYLGTVDPSNAAFSPSNLVLTGMGNGTFPSGQLFPIGTYSMNVKVTDTVSGGTAYGVLNNLQSAANPATLVPTAFAQTATSLTSLPTVTVSPINLGPYPAFSVSGGLPSYRTTLYYNGTSIGSVLGTGSIVTTANTPLPRGLATIQPVVTSGSAYANLAPLTVRIKGIDSLPVSGPTALNGGGAGAGGLGSSIAVGDFNCDGYMDVAFGGPDAPFQKPASWSVYYPNGGVAVYYGNATGLDMSAPPSTAPTGTKPLLIPAPNYGANSTTWGIHFGNSLAAGNINGASVSGRPCSDLVVGAPEDTADGLASDSGAIYVYYGSSSGLQITPYTYNGITCSGTGTNCGTGKYGAGIPADALYSSWGGFGTAVAVGDFNGDGFDDVAVGMPVFSDPDPVNNPGHARSYDGAVFLFFGTANGLSPAYYRIQMPAGTTTSSSTDMGNGLAFGYVSDNTTAPFTGNTAFRKKDLLISLNNLSANGLRGGVLWLKGVADVSTVLDAQGHINGGSYALIQPKQCQQWGGQCGWPIAAADTNNDGFDEIIFGGSYLSPVYTYNGAFFVYYGSSGGPVSPSTIPAVNAITCTNPQSPIGCNPQVFYRTDGYTDWVFSSSLASLGDTNGDGFADIGVGAEGTSAKNGLLTWNGQAYVYYGSSLGLMPSPAGNINLGSKKSSLFGASIAGANIRKKNWGGGKQYNDILVGAPGESAQSNNYGQGSVHYFLNPGTGFSTSITADSGFTPATPAKIAGEYFHYARIVGDLNGDGYADVAGPVEIPGPIGSVLCDSTKPTCQGLRWGIVVYYGSANGLITSPSPTYSPLNPTDPLLITDIGFNNPLFSDGSMGWTVWGAGDTNGDGYADIASGYGTTYVFFGSSTGLVPSPAPLTSPASSLDPRILTYQNNLGIGSTCGYPMPQMAAAGDFNGDGFSDIVGVNSNGATRHIWVVYGSANGPYTGGNIYDPTMGGYALQSKPNQAVYTPTCTGSYPNQLCQPLIICTDNVNGICNGVSPYAQFTHMNGWTYTGPSRIVNVGDVDKDGTDDLAAVDPNDAFYGATSGSLFIFYGSTNGGLSPTNYADIRIQPEYPGVGAARSLGYWPVCSSEQYGGLARGYDINGDGIGDIVVGGQFETSGPNPTQYVYGGAAYVIYGINGGFKSLGAGQGCGSYPCTVNVTAAPGGIPDNQPYHVIDESDASCDPTSNRCNVLRFYPNKTNYASWAFGSGVLGMGDITGDGFGEVAVSAAWKNPGAIFIFSGSQSGLVVSGKPNNSPTCNAGVCTPYLLLMSPDPTTGDTQMAYQVEGWAGAGDIDKDGKKDFLISSYYISDPQGNGFWTGGFYLFH